jgi:hypothetical protein
VTVFDRGNLSLYGYSSSNVSFGGKTAALSEVNNASGSGYTPVSGKELSQYILDADYVINVPVVKSHENANNQITVALKNHYGSLSPSNLCGDTAGMLSLNADAHIKGKTCLVVTDALRGTYSGTFSQSPQTWSGYAEGSPNTLLITTDPVTNEYWARDMINTERALHGLSTRACTWIEQASGAPYDLGVSDPGQMEVLDL